MLVVGIMHSLLVLAKDNILDIPETSGVSTLSLVISYLFPKIVIPLIFANVNTFYCFCIGIIYSLLKLAKPNLLYLFVTVAECGISTFSFFGFYNFFLYYVIARA